MTVTGSELRSFQYFLVPNYSLWVVYFYRIDHLEEISISVYCSHFPTFRGIIWMTNDEAEATSVGKQGNPV